MDAPTSVVRVERRRSGARAWRVGLGVLAVVAVGVGVGTAFGLVYAGSPARLAEGVRIAGVDVGGMTARNAERLLARRSARLADVPVTFVAGSETFRLTPARLDVEADWAAAVEAARRQGAGFAPVRGFRRLQTRFFGAELAPPVRVYRAGLAYELGRLASQIDRRPREAAVELRGLKPVVVPSANGQELDREAAEDVLVRALAGFSRAPVGLPIRLDRPRVATAALLPVVGQVRTAVSAPVRLALGETRWRLPRWRIATLLALPRDGARTLAIGGAAAEAYFDRLDKRVAKPASDADFELVGETVRVVPSKDGAALDERATAKSLLAAALSPASRLARVSVMPVPAKLTTAEARSYGITGVLASYTTLYAGTADRIHNLQLAISLLDGALVPPGRTFSLNERVGERTAERGFRSAPVIIGGRYEEGIGGGVSQVATTIFNVAWEAGLKITERNPHALYISRYPDGRDATVNYPNLDLKFVNDTKRWILVRAFSGDAGITVSLWGAPTNRRVESQAGPLVVTGGIPVKRVKDPALPVGKSVVEEEGQPPRAITVKRTVYRADGSVLHEEAWRTSYRAEYRVVRVGTKKPTPDKAKDKAAGDKPKDGAEPPPPTEDGGVEIDPPPPPPPSP